MKHNINVLIDMMTYCRGHLSVGEEEFIAKYLKPIPGITEDAEGNYHLTVGKNPTTLFSCHTDTVHRTPNIRQKVHTNILKTTAFKKDDMPLGADDAVGIWIMLNLIADNVPGLYIFHRGEERGGIGSSFIADNTPEVLTGIKRAIAFDRKGTTNVITHQGWGRCCSDVFADTLAAKLGMDYRADDTGVFTDTANYTHLIPECTNLSAGYAHEHTSKETQDLTHAVKLCKAALALNWGSLPTVRKPEDDTKDIDGYPYYIGDVPRKGSIADLILDYPEEIADLLEQGGYDYDGLRDYITDLYGFKAA